MARVIQTQGQKKGKQVPNKKRMKAQGGKMKKMKKAKKGNPGYRSY